jgi:predicted membrane-bound spermidine synthase
VSPVRRAFFVLAFTLSGASALVFENLWFRQAGHLLGNAVWTSSIVLAALMLGLAAGNLGAARRGQGVRNPGRVYAALEAAVGVTGLTLVIVLPALPPTLAPVLGRLAGTPWLLNAARAALAFILLLPPTAAMGATLPILTGGLSRDDPDYGRVLGRLYGWNTLGAMLGALGAEVFLVRLWGVTGAGACAAGLNGAAALAAWGAAKSGLTGAGPPTTGVRRRRPTVREASLLLAAAVAGGLLLAGEVVWFRLLLLVVNANSLSFAAMLAAVLLGIALGGWSGAWLLRRHPEADRSLPAWALLGGVAFSATYAFLDESLAARGPAVISAAPEVFRVASELMLVPALLSGLMFTLLGQHLRRLRNDAVEVTGLLTVSNTLGATLGALVGGFVLLPGLGVEVSIFALALGYGVVALCAYRGVGPPRGTVARAALGLALAAFALFAAWFPFGLMRFRYLPRAVNRWATFADSRVLAVREGLVETVAYVQGRAWDVPVLERLITNGVAMSGRSWTVSRYMRLFANLPVALHPDARRVLLISFGVGTTADALVAGSKLQQLDVVDVSRDVLDMGRVLFPAPGTYPLDDPRVHVHVEDGRFFLLTTHARYDIITAEPPPPKNAGIVSLYTREHFQLVYDHLAEGGVVSYWLPVYQLSAGDAQAVTAAFCGAFQDCSLWSGFGLEWILLGTRDSQPVDEAAFTRQWRDPRVAPLLSAFALERPEHLGGLFLGDARDLAEWVARTPPLDDDHPQRLAPALRERVDSALLRLVDAKQARERFARSDWIRRTWPPGLRERTLAASPENALALQAAIALEGYGPPVGVAGLHRLLTGSPDHTIVLWAMGSDVGMIEAARRAAARGLADPEVRLHLGIAAMAARDYARAAALLPEEGPLGGPPPGRLAQWRALAAALAGDRAGFHRLQAAADARGLARDSTDWAFLATLGPDAGGQRSGGPRWAPQSPGEKRDSP